MPQKHTLLNLTKLNAEHIAASSRDTEIIVLSLTDPRYVDGLYAPARGKETDEGALVRVAATIYSLVKAAPKDTIGVLIHPPKALRQIVRDTIVAARQTPVYPVYDQGQERVYLSPDAAAQNFVRALAIEDEEARLTALAGFYAQAHTEEERSIRAADLISDRAVSDLIASRAPKLFETIINQMSQIGRPFFRAGLMVAPNGAPLMQLDGE